MAGLFAWAADVVGANQVDGNEGGNQPVSILLNSQQRHELSVLDAKIASLQQSVQVLRQRVAPGAQGFTERMPHLLADCVASQAALNLEIQAHNTTRLQVQMRQDSLRAENETYAKALAARLEGAKEKEKEVLQYQSSLQELEAKETALKLELEKLQAAVTEKDGCTLQEQEEIAARMAEEGSDSLDYLKELRAELEGWGSKVVKLEKELTVAEQSCLRSPSPVQREKELERRLRNLTEQLLMKQAQAETVANERNALELQLDQLNKACSQLLISGNSDGKLKRNKIGRSSASHTSGEDSRLRVWPVRPHTPKAVRDNMAKVARSVDAFSVRAGGHVWRSKLLRSLTVGYILALHVAVFIILTGRMHRQFQPSIHELP